MVMKRSALGRGLDALITMDDLKTGGSSSISEIAVSYTHLRAHETPFCF